MQDKKKHNTPPVSKKAKKTLSGYRDTEDGNEIEIPSIAKLLGSNPNIPATIEDFYYSLTRQPRNLEECEKNYTGKLERHTNPFYIRVYGAYIHTLTMESLDENMYRKVEDEYDSKHKYDEEEVFEYLKKYAAGFKYGYNNFEEEKINSGSVFFSNDENIRQKIFDYVTVYLPRIMGASLPESYGPGVHKFSGWYDVGKKIGYGYKALWLIVNNYSSFTPLFEEMAQNGKDLCELQIKNPTNNENSNQSNSNEKTFADLLNASSQKLLPYLKKNYTNVKPKRIALLLYALKDLSAIEDCIITDNKTILSKALNKTFGNVGSRQQLGNNITLLSSVTASDHKEIEIIRNALKKELVKK